MSHQSSVRILVLDYDNAIRSQMAEAFLHRLGDGHLQVFSAGLAPNPIHPMTLEVMEEIGYDLAQQQSKSARLFFGFGSFEVAILVSHPDERECPRLFPGALRIERWPNDNPLSGPGDVNLLRGRFRAVRDSIKSQAEAWWRDFSTNRTPHSMDRQLAAVGH